jgi:hypothetical protein
MTEQPVTLITENGTRFQMSWQAAQLSDTFKNIIADIGGDEPIPIPSQISDEMLAKLVEYCEHHGENYQTSLAKWRHTEWDSKVYLGLTEDQKVVPDSVFEIMKAANVLGMTTLLDLIATTVAKLIKKKQTVADIRTLLNVENDFSPEEWEKVSNENKWLDDMEKKEEA